MTDENELERVVKHLRESNSARADARRIIDDTSSLKAVRDAMNSPTMRMIREFQDSSSMRLLQEFQNSPAMLLQKQIALDKHKAVSLAFDNNLLKQISNFHKQQAALFPDTEYARRSLLPSSALQETVKQISLTNTYPVVDISIAERYSSQLKTVLSSIKRPWVLVDRPALSLQGLGALTALSNTVQLHNPFEPPTRDIVNHYLGEPIEIADCADEDDASSAHIEAGMDAGLASLGAPETGEILELTGFKFVIPYAPMPHAVNDEGDELHYDPSYFAFVNQIEQRLRAHIEQEMNNTFGDNWILARISEHVRNEWVSRRDKARSKGEPEFNLIHYAELIELKDIMIGKKTWSNLFSNRFGIKEHFITAMDRLHAVRNPLAHSRPISNGQRLHLHIEGVAILKALGVKIQKK